MNRKILPIVAGIGVALVVFFMFLAMGKQETKNQYLEDNLQLKQKLAEDGVLMSSPIRLQKPEDIAKYCSFFTSDEKQRLIEYCTSTELKGVDSKFLGNIHMVGSPDEPKIVMVLIQTDPFMSQLDSVKTVFDKTIETLVCDCWQEESPDGFSDVGKWVEGLRQFHQNDTQPHSKSKQLVLESKSIQMELTTNKDGYLWQLFIYTKSV
ncbi:MAG: hypothetical protein WAO91_08175 [Candidatus Nitrosotenuis sp.]